MTKSKILKFIFILFLLYLLYILITCTLVPLLGSRAAAKPNNLSTAENSEQVRCIDDNTEALLWRFRVIEEAEHHLILSTFQFDADQSGRDMLAALNRAADRGVHIQILIDGLRGPLSVSTSPHFKALAASENVEIKLYNPINLLTPWTLNYRLHDKYLIADDEVYILGGRNTMDLFLGNYQEKQNIDRDMLVYNTGLSENTSLQQVKAYFTETWNLPCNRLVSCKRTDKIQTAEEELKLHYEALQKTYPSAFEQVDWLGSTTPVNRISFLSNPNQATNKEPQLWRSICEIAQSGEHTIIQTPYIICSKEMYSSLSALTNAGKQVQIITNAVEAGANPWGCTDYLNQKKNILKNGAEVFEYIGEHSLHAKAVLVDDRYSLVGSFNMDMRSAYLDTECMLLIDSPEINAYLKQEIEEDMTESNHVLPDGTETAGSNFTPRTLPPQKQLIYAFLRILIIPFRHLL